MKRSKQPEVERTEPSGPVRLGRDASRLLGRLKRGDIAVLDHLDLDATTAQALVAAGVRAVVNASPSTSGRYPNLGPGVLVAAGVPLLDDVGDAVFSAVREGTRARLEADALCVGDSVVARGVLQDATSVAASCELARAGMAAQLSDLTSNATGFLLDERELLLEGTGIPRLVTELADRPVLVVAAGAGAVRELRLLADFRRAHGPVVFGVDGGADLALAAGVTPDVVVGDLATMSAEVLVAAREVVGAHIPGLPELGVTAIPFSTKAAAEDQALLLAGRGGASVIVTVGFPTTVEQLLDRGRAGASSSLLVRLGLLDRVVGAGAVAVLQPRRFPYGAVVLLLVSVAVLVTVSSVLIGGEGFDLGLWQDRWRELLDRLPW